MRALTDVERSKSALDLTVPVGTKVSFAGGLGAYLAYPDPPRSGEVGTVCTVRSAGGDLTHHNGKIFVEWEDGKFRSIHAEHLRLADPSKAASELKAQFEKIKALAEKKPDSKFLKSLLEQMADKGFAPTDKQMAVVKKIEKEVSEMASMKKQLKTLEKSAASPPPPGGLFKAISRYTTAYAGGSPEEDSTMPRKFLVVDDGSAHMFDIGGKPNPRDVLPKREVDRLFRSGKSKGTSRNTYFTDPEVIRRASNFRVGSLGDLTDFMKVSEGKLVHKSTKDLWSVAKDAEGMFVVERLFDDAGEPIKG